MAAILGAGAGVAAGVVRPLHGGHSAEPPPTELVDALDAERALLAALEAKTGRDPALSAVFGVLHADHVAHAAALTAALREYKPAAAPKSVPAAKTPSRGEQRTAESQAAARAAKRAALLTGSDAALLASIAACEASHAEALR